MNTNAVISTRSAPAVASGSHVVVVPPKAELNELQFSLSNPSPKFDGSLVVATLQRPPDALTEVKNVMMCYKVCNVGAGNVCVYPNLLAWLDEVRVYVNGTEIASLCQHDEIIATYKQNLLEQHGESDLKRRTHHRAEVGTNIVDLSTGCFVCDDIPPGECRMYHHPIGRLLGSMFNQMPLKSVGEIRIEFKLAQDSFKFSNNANATSDIEIRELQLWASLKKNLAGAPKQPFSSYTISRKRYDVYKFNPSQHPFAVANQTFSINLSQIFPIRHNIQRINVYGYDLADPDRAFCRIPVVCEFDLQKDGTNRSCGGEEGSLTAGKRNVLAHIVQSNLKYYDSLGIEISQSINDATFGKNWALDALHTSQSAVHGGLDHQSNTGQPILDASGISNDGNLVIEVKNCNKVLNPSTWLICEIQYLEHNRLSASGRVVKVDGNM